VLIQSTTSSYGRILSVGAEPAFQKQIKDNLEDSGFTVFEADHLEEALSVFYRQKPDLVVSTLQLSEQGGFELLEAVKRDSPETPVVIVTELKKIEEFIEAVRIGAWDYIPRPLNNFAHLEHAVCRALERSRLLIENKNYRYQLEMKNIQLTQSLMQLKEDQKAGEQVQKLLLPDSMVKFRQTTFSYIVMPSLYLSGDFLNYFQINEACVAFYIIDVSGHGASSAFVTVLINSLIDQILDNFKTGLDESIRSPDLVLKLVNDKIHEVNLGKYLTMVYGVIDLQKNELTYSIGGHYPNPILWDYEQAYFLEGVGFAVGMTEKAQFDSYKIQLPKKYLLALFTDGIFEIIPGNNLSEKEQFLLDSVRHVTGQADELIKKMGISAENSLPDDITLLHIRTQ